MNKMKLRIWGDAEFGYTYDDYLAAEARYDEHMSKRWQGLCYPLKWLASDDLVHDASLVYVHWDCATTVVEMGIERWDNENPTTPEPVRRFRFNGVRKLEICDAESMTEQAQEQNRAILETLEHERDDEDSNIPPPHYPPTILRSEIDTLDEVAQDPNKLHSLVLLLLDPWQVLSFVFEHVEMSE